MRMLAVFEKSERIRHIGHLDIQRAMQRGLRRSGLPVAYSNGFSPHILIAFASALSTGACGLREIFDVTLSEPVEPEVFLARMNRAMPPEMPLREARLLPDKHPALPPLLRAASYDLLIRDPAQASRLIQAIPALLSRDQVMAMRKTKTTLRECDIKPLLYAVEGQSQTITTTMTLTERESCKPGMLLEALKREASIPQEEEVRMLVCRTQLLGQNEEGALVPLEKL